jgi:hypothetical protein
VAHNAYSAGRGGTAGDWPTNVAVTPAEFAWFALGVFQSINGDLGGSWSPASVITIGGAGVAFTTVATTFYGITCTGSVTIGTSSTDTFQVNASTTLSGPVTLTDDVTFNGGTSGAHKHFLVGQYYDVTIGGTFTVNGTAAFTAGVTFSSTTSVTGALQVTGLVNFSGGTSGTHQTFQVGQHVDTTISGVASFTGGIQQPIQTITTSGDTITAGTRYVVGNIAGGGYINLPSGHPANAPIEIINVSSMALGMRTPGGSSFMELDGSHIPSGGSFPDIPLAIVYFDGSSWIIFRSYERSS